MNNERSITLTILIYNRSITLIVSDVQRQRLRRSMEMSLMNRSLLRLFLRHLRILVLLVFYVVAPCVWWNIIQDRSRSNISVSINVVARRVAVIRPCRVSCVRRVPRLTISILTNRELITIEHRRTLQYNRRHALTITLCTSTFRRRTLIIFRHHVRNSLVMRLRVSNVILFPIRFLTPSIRLRIRRVSESSIQVISTTQGRTSESIITHPNVINVRLMRIGTTRLSLQRLFNRRSLNTFRSEYCRRRIFMTNSSIYRLRVHINCLSRVQLPIHSTI